MGMFLELHQQHPGFKSMYSLHAQLCSSLFPKSRNVHVRFLDTLYVFQILFQNAKIKLYYEEGMLY